MRFGSILGLGVISTLMLSEPVVDVREVEYRRKPIGHRPKFQIKEQSGPVTDSTPLTKREKRKLRRT